jgi:hypothetical protein
MEPERTTTNGAEETAHDAVSAPGAFPVYRGLKNRGYETIPEMAIQGIPAIQDERDIVPYLTAQALTPCQAGGATWRSALSNLQERLETILQPWRLQSRRARAGRFPKILLPAIYRRNRYVFQANHC